MSATHPHDAEGEAAKSLRRAIRRAADRFRGLFARDSYRPEKHYMRGPGPRAAAKTAAHGRSETA
jgi:hypothetical protein